MCVYATPEIYQVTLLVSFELLGCLVSTYFFID